MAKLLLLLLSLALPVSAEEFDYSAYQSASLAEATANLNIDPRATYWFDASHPRYHTVAVFTGEVREASADSKRFVAAWATSMGHPAGTAEMFSHEARFTQDETTYWMPIQSVLVEPLQTEVEPGGRSHLYVLLMGAMEHVPVLAISEFNAVEPN